MLAIGIVVDNAIIVVEAVHAKMETEGLPPREATFAAMKEISGAIIALTLVMSAVFIPVSFLSGPVGVFYRQFSLTLAVSIFISGINALTLTPALCAIMLKEHNHHKKPYWARKFNQGYNKVLGGYRSVLRYIAGRRTITVAMLLIFIAATYGVSVILPGGFIPMEDQGTFYINVTTPPGATVERTEEVLDRIEATTKDVESIESVSTLAGYSIMTEGEGASYGMGMVNLTGWDERTMSVQDHIDLIKSRTRGITDATIEFFPPPTVPGFGNASGFELRLLDKTGSGNLQKMDAILKDFTEELRNRPEISGAFTTFNPNFPQYLISIDYDVAAQKGVTAETAMENLQILLGGFYATNFIRFGQMYKVMAQALPQYRTKPEDVLKLHVKNNQGEMVPYSAFIRMERVYGPEQLSRYNMYTSALRNGRCCRGF